MSAINLLHLNIKDNQDLGDLPGFYACHAPRRAARGRDKDQFMGLLTLNQPAKASAEKWMRQAAEVFYSTRGSVTAGLKAAAEQVNQEMMKANSRLAREGKQIKGLLNLAVTRGDLLYLAHAGPTRSLVFGSETELFFEPALSGPGLGTSQLPEISYFQTNIQKRYVLLFCARCGQDIQKEHFQPSPRLSLDLLRRQLIHLTSGDLIGELIQFNFGEKDVIQRLRPNIRQENVPHIADGAQDARSDEIVSENELQSDSGDQAEKGETGRSPQADAESTGQSSASQSDSLIETVDQEDAHPSSDNIKTEPFEYELPPFPIPGAEDLRKTNQPPPENLPAMQPAVDESQRIQSEIVQSQVESEPASKPSPRRRTRPASKPEPTPEELKAREEMRLREQARREEEIRLRKQQQQADRIAREKERQERARERKQGMAQSLSALRERLQTIKNLMSNFLPRLLPVDEEGFQLSPASMLFIAVAVPVAVVILATTIYMSRGRGQQHAGYITLAEQAAAAASLSDDAAEQRLKWNEAINWLDTAEDYGTSDRSQELRLFSQQALDGLDTVYRLELKPVLLNSFASSVQVTKIAADVSDLYMLDGAQGVVRRLTPRANGNGYTLDNDFRCGPDLITEVGALMDMALIPGKHASNADVLGLDTHGNLLYCIPREEPVASTLVEPAGGWGLITAMAMHKSYDVLYVMDASNNALYIYYGDNYDYKEAPEKYSNPELSMRDVVDMDVYGEDLYLLHTDGLMTRCTLGVYDIAKTHCEYPARFEDKRPGREGVVMNFKEALFTQVMTTEGLDPSLYLLDMTAPAVYRFSLQMNLHNLLQPQAYNEYMGDETSSATAFAISPSKPGRMVFFAFGHEVYYADLP